MSYGYSDSIQITGLAELQTKLTAFGEKIANQVTQKALNEGANLIKDEAKRLAPEWEGYVNKDGTIVLTHNLKVKGVYIKIWAGNLKKNIKARNIRKTEKGIKKAQTYVKQAEAYYAKWVEGIENGTSRQTPKPFMRPAFETKKDEAVSLFEKYINEEIVSGRL
jgi:HK97 gp10 family phage protein